MTISLHAITLQIEDKKLFDVSFSILPHSIIHLQGNNGSGKTSLLKIIAGIKQPSSGQITIGKNMLDIHELPKPYCCYIGHELGLYLDLTVLDNLKCWANYYDSHLTIEAAIFFWELQDILDTKCSELSAGNKKRVVLARLLICHSSLWLLDEVENNLDEKNKQKLNHIIVSKADAGGIVIITSHEKLQYRFVNNISLQ